MFQNVYGQAGINAAVVRLIAWKSQSQKKPEPKADERKKDRNRDVFFHRCVLLLHAAASLLYRAFIQSVDFFTLNVAFVRIRAAWPRPPSAATIGKNSAV